MNTVLAQYQLAFQIGRKKTKLVKADILKQLTKITNQELDHNFDPVYQKTYPDIR